MNVANWYTIPGFTSYEINIHTRKVRSLKHYKRDCFHIMQATKHGIIRIVDDTGKPIRISQDELYNLTFNSGYELMPREDGAVYKSGMVKGMRKMKSNVDIINGTIEQLPAKSENFYMYDFYKNYIIEDNEEIENAVLDYMKLFEQPKVKPFVINPKNR